MAKRRRFGNLRRLPSGRWQARYTGPDGLKHPARSTFATKSDALVWLDVMAAEIAKDEWVDPDAGRIPLASYAAKWITERPLGRRTADKYGRLLRLHIAPTLGHVDLAEITPAKVRSWRAELLDAGVGASTVAQAYRLLRAVLYTAIDDGLVRGRNPCRIKGADQERTAERPTPTVAEVYAIAEAIRPWYRSLVLLAATTGLRWGELVALRRRHIDLEAGYVDVRAAVIEDAGGLTVSHTKSEAGVRVVGIPSVVLPDLREHMQRWAEPGPDGRVFVGPKGSTPRRKTFNVAWKSALKRAEASGTPMPDGLHFHDLRHLANGFAATGASMRELMTRMGHSTVRAALIYQHARREREREIADVVSERVAEALKRLPR